MSMMDNSEFIPSSFGFRVMKPKDRHQRLVAKDKVALEKERIGARVGIEARMHQANAPSSSAGLTACVEGGAGYLSNSDRFHSDTCGEEYLLRQEQIRRTKETVAWHKRQAEEREAKRWNQQDEQIRKENEYWDKIRDDGCGAKKNQSLVAYDITSLGYHQTLKGEQARYDDDMVRFRGKVRTHQLVTKGDTRATYNIINGDSRDMPTLPDPIPKPNQNDFQANGRRW